MNFVTGLPILTDLKSNSYNLIFVIFNQLTKMVDYKPVKITINVLILAKIIIDVVEKYHSFLNLLVIDRGSLFTSKFWLLLWYFLGFKQKLSTTFY